MELFACQTMSIKAKGEWILSTKTPAFQSFLQNQDTKFGTCETAGVPQSVMLWQTFQGNSEAMALALQKGKSLKKRALPLCHCSSRANKNKH